jgi:hypothetical protein
MRRARISLATAMIVAGCAPDSGVAAEPVAIPGLRCALDVPAGTAVALADDGATFTTRPGTRVPRTFSVHARPPGEPGELGEQRRVLAAGVTIAYTLQTDEGGSGGEESVLDGVLVVGERSFAVRCDDQSEPPGEPDATWCLAWLATLRVDR